MKQICLNLCFLLLATPMAAQATAQQGVNSESRENEFRSPMVVELSLNRLRKDEYGGLYPFTEQAKFICDEVNLPLLLVKRTNTWSKTVELNLKATTYVRPSYDRMVTLDFRILKGGIEVKSALGHQIPSKEKKQRSGSVDLVFAKEEFEELLKGAEDLKLLIRMTVVSDK